MGLEEIKEKSIAPSPVKVLIADDDAPTRILLRAAVSQWGYHVVEASDGEEAWNILQQPDMPQLLIVDWLMPKLDGIDLCRRVKKEIEHFPYIILLTQLTGTTNIVKGLEAGADEFLSKPFNMAELQSRLSVGARIVRYKLKLAGKDEQLKIDFDKATAASGVLSGVSYQLEEIINEVAAPAGSAMQEKLNKMREELQTSRNMIDEISVNSIDNGDDA